METTASLFVITSANTWSGIRFSVLDDSSRVFFESDTRAPAQAVMTYLNNGSDFIRVSNNLVFLRNERFLEFNSLVTKFRLGTPLSKELLCKTKIELKNGSIDWTHGVYMTPKKNISIINAKTLLEVFQRIDKELQQ